MALLLWLSMAPWFLGSAVGSTQAHGSPTCHSLLQRSSHTERTVLEDLPQEAHLEGLQLETVAPTPSGPSEFPEAVLPHNVTEEQEEDAFNSLPDEMFTSEQQEELDREGGAVGGFCGNHVVEDGEDCDSEDPCCTDQCKFAPTTVQCHESADPCDVGGFCSGNSTACVEKLVSPGTACPNEGRCFGSVCASRVEQCSEAGLGSPCDDGCEVLACKNKAGDCITIPDDPVIPGTPCGVDRQCSPEGTCVPTSSLPRDGVTTDSLVDIPQASLVDIPQANRSTLSLASWRSTTHTLVSFKVCYVVSRAAYRKGYNHHKIRELNAFMDLVYRRRSQMPVQFTEPQVLVDTRGELDSVGQEHIGTFSSWVQRKRREGVIGGDVAHVELLGGYKCSGSSGVAYVGGACNAAIGTGISIVADRWNLCEDPKAFAWRWGTVAHEIGHNLGMRHLWDNTGGRVGATQYIMDYGGYRAWQFHHESKVDYNDHKRKFTCMKPLLQLHRGARLVTLQNRHNGRFLFGDGSNVRPSRGLERGWLRAPKALAADANYYNLAKWVLIPVGRYVVLENYETGRVLLGQGSSVKNKPYASEGGWLRAPPVVASDARYYQLYLWERIDSGGGTFFKNAQTGRFLMAQGSAVWGRYAREGGWTRAPQIVNSDANYYNLALWKVS